MPDSRVPPIPESLVQRLNDHECVLFAGNGMAIDAGYPSWYTIMERLAKSMPPQLSSVSPDRLIKLLRQGEINLAAEIIQASVPTDLLIAFLERIYSSPPKLTRTHLLLESLPFAGTISASWDDTLERLFAPKARVVYWTEDPEAAATLLRDSEQFFVRLMGSPRRPKSFVFSIDEYRKRLRTNETFLKFLTHLYSSYTFLFIGSTLWQIESFAEDLAFWSTPSRQHFALVQDSENLDLRAERLSTRFGIEAIPYEASDGYPEVEKFLTELRARLDPGALSLASFQIEPATLDRVVLTNIGPFEQVDLDLTAGWNVLLGDNGCGKSTILRAIALGFCGDDPQGQKGAARLLRAGAATGSIELHVGKQRFVTNLTREGRTVRARSAALTPLQAKRSVILGFPALRGSSQKNPSGPTRGGASRPEVEDLLPLLLGGVDSRLDDAKQWVVNTHVRAEPGDGHSPEDATRCFRLLNTYFEILRDLTPGVDFRFSRIDRETWDVFVRTPDGEVPIDTLSQGTTSILGWVGTLLQRMLEIHGKSDQPEHEAALVLVDEIDAHMHPEWQQSLVPLIKKHFPRLQVIATSHSPLVVGNLEAREVLHVRREAESGKVLVERLNVSFQGWRADQILTSPAFDLQTTIGEKAQQLMDEYASLYGKTQRTPEDQERLEVLANTLRSQIPSHPETPEKREALGLLEEFMHQQLLDQPQEKRERIAAEARDLLAEIDSLEQAR